MGRQGWTRATFKYGDAITLVGHPMKGRLEGHLALLRHSPGRQAPLSRHRAPKGDTQKRNKVNSNLQFQLPKRLELSRSLGVELEVGNVSVVSPSNFPVPM
jgi:hypothetical protein